MYQSRSFLFAKSCIIVSLVSVSMICHSQTSTVFGLVEDIDTGAGIELVTVYVEGTNNAVETDVYGEYRIEVESGKKLKIVYSRIGYTDETASLPEMKAESKRSINVGMAPELSDVDIVIRSGRIEDIGMVKEEVTELKKLPTASGNFESILPHIALGASGGTGGELSAQYNVRGGNYDENLVYVNDFEIFRPQLIRSGQQEGLSFPNIDLIKEVSFSSGGFQAKYGDKMSSVLDIRYKRPDEFRASASMSFLGATTHFEGSKKLGPNAYNKLRYLFGARYKTTQYLLGSLDVTGEYTPNFGDIQSYLTYDMSKDLQVGLLANYNVSQYNFIPDRRVSASGLFTQVLQLTTVFEGQEEDEFQSALGGLSLTYIPERERNPFFIKLLSSYYDNYESEKFDILGFYRLSQVEIDLEGEGGLNEVGVLGTGTQHLNARNRLKSNVANVELRGGIELQSESDRKNNFIQWGLKVQQEEIDDRLNEWERIDSAGYSLPFSQEAVLLDEVIKSQNNITSTRYQAFLQNSYSVTIPNKSEFRITGGVRATHWTYNSETNISPRMQLFYQPLSWQKPVTFKLSGGIYYQPPFYKELRSPQGVINPGIQAQKSTHIVAGLIHEFKWRKISRKNFKLITEFYYKKLDNLISYEIDNVRIRYSGQNDATGYVSGLDLRINGEFVPGAESWINLSFLRAKESLDGVDHQQRFLGDSTATDVKWVPRPTDRFFNLSMFFQDYLPGNNDFKMSLNLSFGSGLPFGVKDNNRVFRNTFSYKNYQRVDIAFLYVIWDEAKRMRKPYHAFRWTQNASIGLEVFNLLQIANVASNTWIKTIGDQQFAIPNFLTSRRINLRLRVDI